MLLGVLSWPTAAQTRPPLDSLIAQFIELGVASPWQPTALFRGCPDLADWQVEGFRRLTTASLSDTRIDNLALIWALQLGECGNAELEEWYFSRLDDAVRRRDWNRTLRLRTPIFRFDTPATRAYLRARKLDETFPVEARSTMDPLSARARRRGRREARPARPARPMRNRPRHRARSCAGSRSSSAPWIR